MSKLCHVAGHHENTAGQLCPAGAYNLTNGTTIYKICTKPPTGPCDTLWVLKGF